MRNLIKAAAVISAAFTISISSPMVATARDTDYTRDELVEKFWTDYWEDSDPGEINPEGSLEYYILQCFLDEEYGTYDPVWDWSDSYSIRKAWEDYYEEYTKCWHYNDDEETGEFTIDYYDPETDTYTGELLYTFELIDGMWNMIDTNGNSVLVFEPHGGDGSYRALVEKNNSTSSSSEEAEESADEDREEVVPSDDSASSEDSASGSSNGSRVTGTVSPSTEVNTSTSEVTKEASEEDVEEESSHRASYIVGGIVLVGVGIGAVSVYRKKKK